MGEWRSVDLPSVDLILEFGKGVRVDAELAPPGLCAVVGIEGFALEFLEEGGEEGLCGGVEGVLRVGRGKFVGEGEDGGGGFFGKVEVGAGVGIAVWA